MNTDRFANTGIGRLSKRISNWFGLKLLSYYKASEPNTLRIIKTIYREEAGVVLLDPEELFMIYSLAKAQRGRGGDYAEVGVFRGASAKAICEAKGETALHLFDTFEGLPSVSALDSRFKKGMSTASEDLVRERLKEYSNVSFHTGLFPATGAAVLDRKFSFVHLDVDTYESTSAALSFFYTHLLPGGILLSHDYAQCLGVRKAFDEFMADKPDTFIELPFTQCMIIKS